MKKRYQSDLSDEEWAIIYPMIPACKPGGRPRRVNIRHIMNAIFYLLKTGCQWRMLPQDCTVHYYFRRWRLEGVWFKYMNNYAQWLVKNTKKMSIQQLELWTHKASKRQKKGALWI